mmetsp:Transcript_28547/g.77289  ORF Transcript_28547/g.77289 Transcript_28547/m.77289 type:complete len:202 (-) Transcript_28547:750-1355(-)
MVHLTHDPTRVGFSTSSARWPSRRASSSRPKPSESRMDTAWTRTAWRSAGRVAEHSASLCRMSFRVAAGARARPSTRTTLARLLPFASATGAPTFSAKRMSLLDGDGRLSGVSLVPNCHIRSPTTHCTTPEHAREVRTYHCNLFLGLASCVVSRTRSVLYCMSMCDVCSNVSRPVSRVVSPPSSDMTSGSRGWTGICRFLD